jgi:hypothetical protein
VPYSRAVALVALVAAAVAAVFVIREQRDTNRKILDTLGDVKTALADQTRRAGELEQHVAGLSERVISLETEVGDLRRRVVRLSRRPVEAARLLPASVESIALAPFAASPTPHVPSPMEVAVLETLPITWATDWTSYQPAGIVAAPAPIVLQRKLADPAFLKKLYFGYAALQAGDVISTTAALKRGAREGNPLIRGIAGSPAAMIGVKVAAGVATIVMIEKLRETRPVLATVTLIAMNATLAAVTVNNVAVAARASQQ